MVYGLGLPQDATVVDAFCGTGALGLEALSRGAAHVTFIDAAAPACDSVRQTLADLGAAPETYSVICADAAKALAALVGTTQLDLLLADPPYGCDPWQALMELAFAGVLVAEADHYLEVGEGSPWEQYRRRRYGRGHVTILRYLQHPQG